MKTFSFLILSLSLCLPAIASDDTIFIFTVKHDHFWGSGTGDLAIDQEGITYSSETDNDHATHWSYSDIQELKIESPRKIYIRTYQDVGWKFNRDRTFEFDVVERDIDTQVVDFLRESLPTQLVSAVFTPPHNVAYAVPAKHQHALGGGCHGELVWSEEGVYYNTSESEHSRFWAIEDIESLGRMSRFKIRFTVREHSHSGSIRNFQFQLKGPMDDGIYQQLWRRIYEPKSWLTQPSIGGQAIQSPDQAQ